MLSVFSVEIYTFLQKRLFKSKSRLQPTNLGDADPELRRLSRAGACGADRI